MMENERSIEEPFSALGSYFLLADMMLSAFCTGGNLQFPSPTLTEFSPSVPPLLVRSVVPPHSLGAISVKKEKSMEY